MRYLLLAGIISMAAMAAPPDLSAQAFCDTQATGMQLPIPAYNKPWHQWSRCMRNSLLVINSTGAVLGSGATNYFDRLLVNSIGALDGYFITLTSPTVISSSTFYINGNAGISFQIGASSFVITSAGDVSIVGDVTAPTFIGDLTGNSDTATALAANGGNAASGFLCLGVDASGACEPAVILDALTDGATSPLSANAAFDADALKLDLTGGTITGNLEISSATLFINGDAAIPFQVGVASMTLTSDGDLTIAGDMTAVNYNGNGAALTNVGTAEAANASISAKVNEGAGVTIGQCVYISGATGQFPQVSLCDNTDSAKHEFLGLAAETKTNGQTILITVIGEIEGVDTDGTGAPGVAESWDDGEALYMITAGNLSNVLPTSGGIHHVGSVGYSHGSNGKIVVTTHEESYLAVPSGVDIDIRMGDTAGANKVSFEDYNDVEVGSINSDGQQVWAPNTETTSTMTATGELQAGGTGGNWFSGNLGLGTTNPATKLEVSGGTITVSASGNPGGPEYSFIGDTNTGMFAPDANTIAFATDGVERMRINTTGVVVGTDTAKGKFHVFSGDSGATAINQANDFIIENNGVVGFSILTIDAQDAFVVMGSPSAPLGAHFGWTYSSGIFEMVSHKVGAIIQFRAGNNALTMTIEDGQVGIGNSAPSEALDVTGNIAVSGTVDGVDIAARDHAATVVDDTPNDGNTTEAASSNAVFDHGNDVTHSNGIAGEAVTAAALATNQPACSGGEFVTDMDADGTLTCAAPAGGGDVVTTATQTFSGINTFYALVIPSSGTISIATNTTTTAGRTDINTTIGCSGMWCVVVSSNFAPVASVTFGGFSSTTTWRVCWNLKQNTSAGVPYMRINGDAGSTYYSFGRGEYTDGQSLLWNFNAGTYYPLSNPNFTSNAGQFSDGCLEFHSQYGLPKLQLIYQCNMLAVSVANIGHMTSSGYYQGSAAISSIDIGTTGGVIEGNVTIEIRKAN